METLALAHVLAWGAVFAYVGWIVVQNRCLSRRLDEMQTLRNEGDKEHGAKAA